MLWDYIGRILTFAFRRTNAAIDSLQVLAASALPAIAMLFGIRLAGDASTNVLAYIGFVVLALVVFRLLSAPFFIWREQIAEIDRLKHALNSPDRLENEMLSQSRVRSRLKLAAHIFEYYMHAYSSKGGDTVALMGTTGMKLVAKSGTSHALRMGYSRMVDYAQIIRGDRAEEVETILADLVNNLNSFLHREIDEAALAACLPPDIHINKMGAIPP